MKKFLNDIKWHVLAAAALFTMFSQVTVDADPLEATHRPFTQEEVIEAFSGTLKGLLP